MTLQKCRLPNTRRMFLVRATINVFSCNEKYLQLLTTCTVRFPESKKQVIDANVKMKVHLHFCCLLFLCVLYSKQKKTYVKSINWKMFSFCQQSAHFLRNKKEYVFRNWNSFFVYMLCFFVLSLFTGVKIKAK